MELDSKLAALRNFQRVQDQLHISLTSWTIGRIANLPCVPHTVSLQDLKWDLRCPCLALKCSMVWNQAVAESSGIGILVGSSICQAQWSSPSQR